MIDLPSHKKELTIFDSFFIDLQNNKPRSLGVTCNHNISETLQDVISLYKFNQIDSLIPNSHNVTKGREDNCRTSC